MKKIIAFVFMFIVAFVATSSVAFASTECTAENPCANGPVVPMFKGWRHLNPGQEDCPAWFFLAGCQTPNPVK